MAARPDPDKLIRTDDDRAASETRIFSCSLFTKYKRTWTDTENETTGEVYTGTENIKSETWRKRHRLIFEVWATL